MNNSPQISIICPLYNKKEYILETINSVLEQTYADWEFIIVDDGSTDGSYDIVEEYIKDKEKIKLYKRADFKENKGGSVCRNIGIYQAEGDFIIFLDADDVLLPFCIERRVKLAHEYPQKDYYIFNHHFFKESPQNKRERGTIFKLHKLIYRFKKDKRKHLLRQFLKYNILWQTTGVFWRRETLLKIGGFDERFQRLQDPEIHTKVLLRDDLDFACFLFNGGVDFLMRSDINRYTNTLENGHNKINIYFESTELYIKKFIKLKSNKRLFNGYLYQLSMKLDYVLLNNRNKMDGNFISQKRSEILKLQHLYSDKKRERTYLFFSKLHSNLIKSKLYRSLKLPALISIIYRHLLL